MKASSRDTARFTQSSDAQTSTTEAVKAILTPTASNGSAALTPAKNTSKVLASVKSALKVRTWKIVALGGAAALLTGAGLITAGALTVNPMLIVAGIVCAAVGLIFLIIGGALAIKNAMKKKNLSSAPVLSPTAKPVLPGSTGTVPPSGTGTVPSVPNSAQSPFVLTPKSGGQGLTTSASSQNSSDSNSISISLTPAAPFEEENKLRNERPAPPLSPLSSHSLLQSVKFDFSLEDGSPVNLASPSSSSSLTSSISAPAPYISPSSGQNSGSIFPVIIEEENKRREEENKQQDEQLSAISLSGSSIIIGGISRPYPISDSTPSFFDSMPDYNSDIPLPTMEQIARETARIEAEARREYFEELEKLNEVNEPQPKIEVVDDVESPVVNRSQLPRTTFLEEDMKFQDQEDFSNGSSFSFDVGLIPLRRITSREEEMKHMDAEDYAGSFFDPITAGAPALPVADVPRSEEEVKEKDCRLVAGAEKTAVVAESWNFGDILNIGKTIVQIPESHTVRLFEKQLRAMGPVCHQLSPKQYLALVTQFANLKDQVYVGTKLATRLGIDGEVIDSVFASVGNVCSRFLSTDQSSGALQPRDQASGQDPSWAGLGFDWLVSRQKSVPDRMVQEFLHSHQRQFAVAEGTFVSNSEKVHNAQWGMMSMANTAWVLAQNTAASFISSALPRDRAEVCASGMIQAIGQGVMETLKTLGEQDEKGAVESQGAKTAKMLHSLFLQEAQDEGNISHLFADKLKDLLADILCKTNEKVNAEYMKITVVTPLGHKVIDLATEAGLKMLGDSQPELYNLIKDGLKNPLVQAGQQAGRYVLTEAQKTNYAAHIYAYVTHWKNVTSAMFDDKGQLSFDQILASSNYSNPGLAHSLTSLCSIIGRGNGQLTKNLESYLRTGMAAYEAYNYVASSDPVAFTQELTEAIKADKFLNDSQTQELQVVADGFKEFWTAPSDPRIAQFATAISDAANQARSVRIQVPSGPIEDRTKDALKAATDLSKTTEVVAIGTTVAVNYLPAVASKALATKVCVESGDIYGAGANILSLLFSSSKATAHAAAMHAVNKAAKRVKDEATDRVVSAARLDSLVATLTGQTCVFLDAFSTNVSKIGEREEEQEVAAIEAMPEPVVVRVQDPAEANPVGVDELD